MICNPCRKAGELNKLLGNHRGSPHLEKMIRASHNDCPGGNWCDCHHDIGQVLNPTMIGDKNAVSE
jgi:hypothetical protein